MKTFPLSEILAADSAVFIDNVALCSADRVLGGWYHSVQGNRLLSAGTAGPATLVAHDLVNLSILVESLLCFDELYTNSEFVDRWNSDIASGLLTPLDTVVIGVLLTRDQRWQAESAVVRSGLWTGQRGLDPADALAVLVAHANHDCWVQHRATPPDERAKEQLLTPYDEASRPFGGSAGIAIGAGFYMMCSQALGVPYRPSAVRAELMQPILWSELRSWRFHAGSVALEYLEMSRKEAAEQYFGKLAALGVVEVAMPLVLGGVLANADEPSDVLAITLSLRNSAEGRAFREWSGVTTAALEQGNLRAVARLLRELESVVNPVNRSLGVKAGHAAQAALSIGYGPIKVSKPFQLPDVLGQLRPITSHVWLMQGIYRTLLNLSSFAVHVERVLFPGLPFWLQERLAERPIDWKGIEWRARPVDS
jgi:hypothetical protein